MEREMHWDQSQDLLLQKIIRYLECALAMAENEESHAVDLENRRKYIAALKKSGGKCVGLSTLWAYGRRMEDVAPRDHSTNDRDDVDFFHRVRNNLVSWDGETAFNTEEQSEIERFINNIELYQMASFTLFENSTKMQLDLSVTLEDTTGEKPHESFRYPKDHYEQQFMCSEQMLGSRLEQIVKPGSMIFVCATKSRVGHTVAIYRTRDGEMYYYNPNDSEGESRVEDMHELTTLLWRAGNCLGKQFDTVHACLRDMAFCVYHFASDPCYQYPTEEALHIKKEEFLELFNEIAERIPTQLLAREIQENEQMQFLFGSLHIDQVRTLLEESTGLTPVVEAVLKEALKASVVMLDQPNPVSSRPRM